MKTPSRNTAKTTTRQMSHFQQAYTIGKTMFNTPMNEPLPPPTAQSINFEQPSHQVNARVSMPYGELQALLKEGELRSSEQQRSTPLTNKVRNPLAVSQPKVSQKNQH